jgi:adenosylhomocysteinase
MKGHGADVIVLEVDPLRALEAVMDGFRVMPVAEAAKTAKLFVTATGDIHVLRGEHFAAMQDGTIIANTGHFNVEIDIPALEALSVKKRAIREFVDEYTMADGRRIYLLADGRLVNLAAAEGHPAAVMDMSFANQSLSVEYLALHGASLARSVHGVPVEIDSTIARLKLSSMGVRIDSLSAEQDKYLHSWEMGT